MFGLRLVPVGLKRIGATPSVLSGSIHNSDVYPRHFYIEAPPGEARRVSRVQVYSNTKH